MTADRRAARPARTALVPADALAPVLVVAIAVVAALGVGIELVHARSHAAWVEALVALLSLSHEQNVPTWLATCLLFSSGVALAGVAAGASARGEPARRWWGLAALLLYASLDELAELHENLAGLGGGLVYFDWIVPATLVVAALGALYLPFLRTLPPPTRRRFVAAAAIYLAGALAMELPLGWWAARAGDDDLGYALIDAVEEALELAGAALFLLAVRAHARDAGRPPEAAA